MERESAEFRKGPWTEQEDVQLAFYVNLFGDRRWDFIAKVSGLGRTGKSCRLRWVNYLNPGLKRGKMTQKEEKMVMELHSKWGNRWSRIARNLPGRTDNEIKNYWRTHMRRTAQEKKKATSQTPSSSSSSNSTSSVKTEEAKGHNYEANIETGETAEASSKVYSLDEIWKDIELSEENSCFTCPRIASPIWDFRSDLDSLWTMGEEENKMVMQQQQQMVGFSHSAPFYYYNTSG